jgi:hypothetical protein
MGHLDSRGDWAYMGLECVTRKISRGVFLK